MMRDLTLRQRDLTPRQIEVLEFIEHFIRTNQRPPTRADIANGFGWKSPNAAEDHLRAMQRKGVLFLSPGIARGIELAEHA